MYKRARVEISIDNLRHNYDLLRSRLPGGCRFLGVVKADAYGHGAALVASRLEKWGADYLAVARLDEALALRRAGIELPILILGCAEPERAQELIACGLTQTVYSRKIADALSAEAHGREIKAHLKLDTGMCRLGVSDAAAAAQILKTPNLDFEGVFTHFATADMPEQLDNTRAQFSRFMELVAKTGFDFKIRHCCNSPATLEHPEYALDMVRPGIALYGYCGDYGLKPVMSVKGIVAQVKAIAPGDGVSYGRAFIADRPVTLAVVNLGYADGIPRSLSNRLEFNVNGNTARQVGRVCMDMCMLDVTGMDVSPGDEVEFFGVSGVTAQTIADMLGTIPYVVLCAASKRLPRVETGGEQAAARTHII